MELVDADDEPRLYEVDDLALDVEDGREAVEAPLERAVPVELDREYVGLE